MSSSIRDEIEKQSTTTFDGKVTFLCETCKNYKGSCICEKGVFIAFVGANIPLCHFYEQGKKCPYCGRNI